MTNRLPLYLRPLALAVLVLISATPLVAAPRTGSVRAAVQGELIEARGTDERAEVVSFGADLVPALTGALKDETVRVADWPLGPQERADVLLTRFDVYAPGARVLVDEGNGRLREIPRSRLAFFSGTAANDPEVMIFASVDPDSGHVNGFTRTRDAFHEIHPLSEVPSLAVAQGVRRHLVAPAEVFVSERGEDSSWTCGQSGAPLDFLQEMDQLRQASEAQVDSVFASAITTLHTATIAVDTDNELLSIKFGNNTTTAGNYIASLIASMTVIYERDLLVRLLQGETILRPSSQPDPYNQATAGSASSAKLNEFSNIWNTTYANVPRALAMMLSGKGGSGASGIAWLNGLCNDYYGTSFSQVFTSGTTPSSGDILVVAHELGHNFGSPHTHCYSPAIDNCYNAEPGCFSGTRSCPAPQTINGVTNVTGTLMSYCHVSGISGCSSKHVFHPATVTRLQPIIQGKVNSCIFPAATAPPAPTLTAVSPASGPVSGGTAVTITGTNFQSGATVTFGGTAATSVTVVNATRITAVAPAKATGKVAVAVTNPDTQGATLNPGFFYAPAPSVADFFTVSPCRIVDTTDPTGPLGGPALTANQTRTFDLTGPCGVPAGAKALALNITVLNPTAQGNLQMFPGNAMPLGTSTLNYAPGLNLANNAVLPLATDGTGTLGVRNASAGTTGVLIDVVGYFQ